MRFSIPYNGDNQLVKNIYSRFGKAIHEVYLAPNHSISATGRSNDGYNKKNRESNEAYENKIFELMSFCKKNDIRVNILFNPSFINFDLYTNEGFKFFISYIDNLYKNHYISDITIIDPYIVSSLKDVRNNIWKDLKIHASVNFYGNTLNRIKILESLGIDNLCIDRDINRNLELLKNIKKNTNIELKLLVNEGCILGCPFRKHHHERKEVYTGSTELLLDLRKSIIERFDKPITTNLAFCLDEYRKNPQQLFRSPFVRPEDLIHYSDIIDIFKIAGREMASDRLEEIIIAYVTGSYDGDFLKLIFRFYENLPFSINNKKIPKDFFNKMQKCSQNCKKCGYCYELIKLLKPRETPLLEKWKTPDKNENWFEIGKKYFEIGKYLKAKESLEKINILSDPVCRDVQNMIHICNNLLKN